MIVIITRTVILLILFVPAAWGHGWGGRGGWGIPYWYWLPRPLPPVYAPYPVPVVPYQPPYYSPPAQPQSAPLAQPTPLVPQVRGSQDEIMLEHRGSGGYYLNSNINQSGAVIFKLDTGADDICLSQADVNSLTALGALSQGDYLGTDQWRDASGGTHETPVVRLREMTLGTWVLSDIPATVCGMSLLGTRALHQFKTITIDYQRGVLVLGEPQ